MPLKNENSFIKNISILLSPYKKRLVAVVIFMLILSAVTALTPLINRAIIDIGIVAQDFRVLLFMFGLSGLLFIIKRVVDFLEFKQSVYITNNLSYRLLFLAQKHLLKLPHEYFKENNESQMISNFRQDIGKISQITDTYMMLSVVQIFNIFGGIIGLFFIDVKLLMVILLAIPVKAAVIKKLAKRHEVLYASLIKRFEKYSAWFGDVVNSVKIVKLWNLRRKSLSDFKSFQKDIIHGNTSLKHNDKISENIDAIINFTLDMVIYLIGFFEILSGRLTIGGLFAIISYSSQIINPVTFLTRIRFYFADMKPSLKRHIDFLSLPEEDSENDKNLYS